MPKPTRLKRAYLRFNRLYFGNLLPTDKVVKWRNIGPNCYGLWAGGDIYINARLKKWPDMWKMTLLHEMAHDATATEHAHHGRRWQREMRRLARVGAFDRLW